MSVYALIQAGVVEGLVSPPDGQALSDLPFLSPAQVQSAVHVSGAVMPRPGWTYSTTQGFAAPTPAQPPTPPTPKEAAASTYGQFIATGLHFTCTSIPALDGIYALDPEAQLNIAQEAQYISTFSEFTNTLTSSLEWSLADGTPVVFPTIASFMAFAKATAQTVAAAKLAARKIAAGVPGALGTMPSNSINVP
jgi:hypothetical protein